MSTSHPQRPPTAQLLLQEHGRTKNNDAQIFTTKHSVFISMYFHALTWCHKADWLVLVPFSASNLFRSLIFDHSDKRCSVEPAHVSISLLLSDSLYHLLLIYFFFFYTCRSWAVSRSAVWPLTQTTWFAFFLSRLWWTRASSLRPSSGPTVSPAVSSSQQDRLVKLAMDTFFCVNISL